MTTLLPIEYNYATEAGTQVVRSLPMTVTRMVNNIDDITTYDVEVETDHALPPKLALQETLAYHFGTADGDGTIMTNGKTFYCNQWSADSRTYVNFKIKQIDYRYSCNTSSNTITWCADPYIDTSSCNFTLNHAKWQVWEGGKVKSASERLRDIINGRATPHFHVQQHAISRTTNIKELRARETLKLVVGREMYEKFIKRGFVSVQNPVSGRVYQIFPGHGFTNVYEKGVMIERLCVYLKGDFPPTDAVIVRYLMAINNEEQLWKLANKHGAFQNRTHRVVQAHATRSLVDIFREFKKAS